MSGKPSNPTKTIKQTLEYRFPEWFKLTEKLFNEVTAFYFGIIQEHELILELTNKEALTELEKLTHETRDNPFPPFPLKWSIPAMFRRACINTALGSARSLNEGEQDNKDLWAKVNNIDDYEAHRVSRRIVDFALEQCHNLRLYCNMQLLFTAGWWNTVKFY